ncbi:MAG: YhfC family intramembrane metalloprotease, partial [Lachnospiraceae bacterium]|nr:YhfC family intramembrane metalloprotease [Lachnospiraceae bacterium]
MVSTTSIIFMVITLVISLILPIVLFIAYAVANKGKGIVSAWFLGAAGFFVLQILIRLPILSVLGILPGFQSFVAEHYVIYVLILGFTAGLFEVVGRFAVAKIMSKNLTYKRGIAAGLGHGGIEAMVIVGMTYINNLLYAAMINGGTYDTIIEQTAAMGVDVSSLYAIKASLIDTPAYMFGLAGYERLLTMICHVAMSLLVCYFVAKKQTLKGVLISLVLHTILDTASGLISGMATPYMGQVISQN